MEIFGTNELWERLKNTKKPILLYGMGNGADKILSVLEKTGVEASGFFASDGFVRGHFFHEKKVMTYSEACERFGDFVVLVSFGSSLPDVMAKIKKVASEKETYAPDVPVAGEELFNAAFFRKHEKDIDAARSVFADQTSKKVFDEIVRYKLDGKISHFQIDSPKSDALKTLLSGGYTAYIDLGAYTGDTLAETIAFFPTVKRATALEPSPKVFKKLEKNAVFDGINIRLYNMAASSGSDVALFADGAGRNSQLFSDGSILAHDSKSKEVKTVAVDDICAYFGEKLLIKLDIEGSESAALDGMRRIFSENDCELIVSAYHRSEDIFALPLKLKELFPSHSLYLCKHPYIPAWDINIYVKNS